MASSPVDADTAGDGLPDGDELNTHGSNPAEVDTDGDGLGDYVKVTVHGSNPSNKDTGGDGFEVHFKDNTGFDPASDTGTPDTDLSIRTCRRCADALTGSGWFHPLDGLGIRSIPAAHLHRRTDRR